MRSATLVINNKNESSRNPYPINNLVHRPTTEYAAIGGLPQQFVNSMMTLFNMLDDSKTGLVPLIEIERRWREDAVPNLPGVLDSLRAVAPSNGLLSFPLFVHGLRSALTRARSKDANTAARNRIVPPQSQHSIYPPTQSAFRQYDKPIPKQQLRNRPLRHRRSNSGPVSTALVLPNRRSPDMEMKDDIIDKENKNSRDGGKIKPTEKETSELDNLTANTLFVNPTQVNKPIKLSGKYIGITGTLNRAKSSVSTNYNSLTRPHIKPHNNLFSKSASSFPAVTRLSSKSNEIRRPDALKKEVNHPETKQNCVEKEDAKMEMVANKSLDGVIRRCNSYSPPSRASTTGSSTLSAPLTTLPCTDAPVECKTSTPLAHDHGDEKSDGSGEVVKCVNGEYLPPSTIRSRRRTNTANRRNDPRRHTVANGVDFNVLKCVKQIEREMDLLTEGLSASEQSRDWLQHRLNVAKNKYKFITECGAASSTSSSGKISTSNSLHGMSKMQSDLSEELWSNASLQRSQNLLTTLASSVSSLRNVADSLTTEIKDTISPNENDETMDASNTTLLQKVVAQNEKIAQLEKEKAMLVKQLFQTKAEVNGTSDTSIFI